MDWQHLLSRMAIIPAWVRVLLVAYLIWLVILYFQQSKLLYHPENGQPLAAPPAEAMVLHREIAAGTVEAWYFPGPTHPAPLVVIFHGNGSLIDTQLQRMEFYRGLGCAVLLPEYRGYGRSAGKPRQKGIVDDAVWFVEQAVSRPEVDPTRVAYHGTSLGGNVAVQVAARRRPRAMVLQSTTTSIASFAKGYGAPGWLVRDSFRSDRLLPKLDLPVLILHGTRDTLVPIEHAHRLAELAPRGKLVELAGAHNDLPRPNEVEAYQAAIADHLRAAGVLPSQP